MRGVSRKSLASVATAVVACGALALVPSAATAARSVSCGEITVMAKLGNGAHKPFHFVNVVVSGLSCKGATGFLKAFASGPPPAGWRETGSQTVKGKYPIKTEWRKGNERLSFQYSCNGC